MANGTFGSGIWGMIVIGGFVVLGIAIAWAARHNRQTPRQEKRTEDATRALYDEQPGRDERPR